MEIIDSNLLEFDNRQAYCYQGKRFTGIVRDYDDEGVLIEETSVKDGMIQGLCCTWFPNGMLKSEQNYKNNIGNGIGREWFANGILKDEQLVEVGIIITRKTWDVNGALIYSYDIEKDDIDGKQKRILESRRKTFS